MLVGAVILTVGIALEQIQPMLPLPQLFNLPAYEYLALMICAVGYLLLGADILLRAGKNILRGKVFDENFLMSIATIGAFAIGEYAEAVGVMLFFQVGEYFQQRAVGNSKRSIAALMDIRPDFAHLKNITTGQLSTVAPDTVQPGDTIVVKPGERIPLDGTVEYGNSLLDTAALTGESRPRAAAPGDTVLSGCINQTGVLTITVTQTFANSTVVRILDLVENAASRKAPAEQFITKFARYYTPIVVGLAILVATVPPLFFGGDWVDWLSRALIFLVISCPCALVISIPLSFFGGIGSASRNGILVKGGNYLDALTRLDTVVFDKTGTLTEGVFAVSELLPAEGFSSDELLGAAARAEVFSNHPIALSIRQAYEATGGVPIDTATIIEHQELAGYGVLVRIGDHTILAGNQKLMDTYGIVIPALTEPVVAAGSGFTTGAATQVHIAMSGRYVGSILISDKVKPDSRTAIAELKALGVQKTVMLTGDNQHIATAIAAALGMDDAYGDLLPQQKVEEMDALRRERNGKGEGAAKGALAFVGDGINDAPVLALADVGVAMGGLGSDAAIEAADVVLMTDEPSKLVEAVRIARATRRIVWQNIVFALGIKVVFMILGTAGVASMWEAVFADVGVSLLAVLNASRLLKLK